MVRIVNGKELMLGPRNKGLAFTTPINKFHTLSKTVYPGPEERVGWGAIGFDIELDGKKIVNLGDTLLHEKEWQRINAPDVLMIPIGGKGIQSI
jgi:L-ascorbate metabolism protein UlaG (beta-lactamase superfamily)